MQSFTSILDRPSNEIERPKPFPVGTYVCLVVGMPEHGKSSQKQTPFVRFTLKPLAPFYKQDNEGNQVCDVDTNALTEMGGCGEKVIKNNGTTFYLTEESAFRLVDFLNVLEAGEESMTLSQRLDFTPNCQVLGTIKHTASQDGKSIYAEFSGFAKVP